MHSIVEQFKMGGWGMFPTLIFGLIFAAISIRYAVSPKKAQLPLVISLGVLTLSSGLLGFVTGLITTAAYYADMSNPDPRIPWVGFGESLNNVAFALVFTTFAAIAVTIGAHRLSKQEPSANKSAA